MQKPDLLDKNKIPYDRQLSIARIVLFIFTALFAIETSRDIVELSYQNWGIGIEYLYLKIGLLSITLTVLSFSFINKYFAQLLSRINFLFTIALFYIVALSIYIEGVNITDEFYLLALSILIYFIYYEFKEVFYYVLFSNTTLLLLYIFPRTGTTGLGNEWLLYLILTIGLTILKYFDYHDEEEVLSADEFYRKAFNAIRESIMLLDPKSYQIEYYNDTAAKTFSLSKTDQLTIRDMVAGSSKKTIDSALKIIFNYKGVWEGEMVMLNKDKKEFISKTSISYLKQEGKELLFIKCLDITSNKYADNKLKETLNDLKGKNQELEETKLAVLNVLEDINVEKAKVLSKEQKLQAILQSIAEGVVVIDADKKISMFNSTFLELLGLTRNDVEGRVYNDVLKMVNETTGDIEDNDIPDVFKTGKPLSRFNTTQLLKKNGELLDVNETFSPIVENGKVIRLVAVFRDATEQRKVERMRSEFVSIASHQLRTPLTAISWYLEMLMDPTTVNNLTDEQKGYINQVFESNKKMIYLVNELLDISRIEEGKELQLIKEKGDIIKLIQEVIEEQKGLLTQKDLELEFNTQGQSSIMVNMDKEKIRQVIMNLINNAIKYSRPDSKIILDVKVQDEKLLINFVDSGIGIPKSQQEMIFDKFFRAENALKMQAQGTGLGLYVVREIVKDHGGTIDFTSEENKGTTFSLLLPLV